MAAGAPLPALPAPPALPALFVDALDSGADAADDLPGNRPNGRSHFPRVDALPALRALVANDDHLITRLDLYVGDIDRDHVHADSADDGHATTPNQHMTAAGEARIEA